MNTRPDTFVEDDRLFRLADKLTEMKPCPITGRRTRDQYITAFGEFGDIWPESIREDLILAAVEDTARRNGSKWHG